MEGNPSLAVGAPIRAPTVSERVFDSTKSRGQSTSAEFRDERSKWHRASRLRYQVAGQWLPYIAQETRDVGGLLRAHQHVPAVTQGILQFAGNYRDISGNDHGAVAHPLGCLHVAEGFGHAVAGELARAPGGQHA